MLLPGSGQFQIYGQALISSRPNPQQNLLYLENFVRFSLEAFVPPSRDQKESAGGNNAKFRSGRQVQKHPYKTPGQPPQYPVPVETDRRPVAVCISGLIVEPVSIICQM